MPRKNGTTSVCPINQWFTPLCPITSISFCGWYQEVSHEELWWPPKFPGRHHLTTGLKTWHSDRKLICVLIRPTILWASPKLGIYLSRHWLIQVTFHIPGETALRIWSCNMESTMKPKYNRIGDDPAMSHKYQHSKTWSIQIVCGNSHSRMSVMAEMCSERDSPLKRLYRRTHAKLACLAGSRQLLCDPGCELSLALVHARRPAWPGKTSAAIDLLLHTLHQSAIVLATSLFVC